MDQNNIQAIGGAFSAILAALGVSPIVGEVVAGLLAVAKVGPEVYDLIKQDVAMFQDGKLTLEQLQARFAAQQQTFEALAARWKAPA